MGRVLGSNARLVDHHSERTTAIRSGVLVATRYNAFIAAVVVAVPALALYGRTLLRDVGFWDTAEFQAIGPVLGIAHPTGYPAYTLLAWLASVVLQPFGNEALRANLLSAILVAVAVGMVGATVTRLTGHAAIGIATAAALAVSGETWAIALRADPHALHLTMAALLLLLLVVWQDRVQAGEASDRWLFASAVVFGISLANHALTYLLAPGIGLFVLAVQPGILRRPLVIAACTAGLVLAAAVLYAYLPIRSAMNPPMDYANPETWEGFRYLVFAEQFRGTFQALPSVADALRMIALETGQQLGVFALLALVGIAAAAARRAALLLLLGGWFGVNWFFALGYVNADIGRYYLVPFLVVAVLGGLGAGGIVEVLAGLWRRIRGDRQPAIEQNDEYIREEPGEEEPSSAPLSANHTDRPTRAGGVAAIVLALVTSIAFVAPSLAAVPSKFGRIDASQDGRARMWLTTVLDRLPPNAVVVSWWSYSTTLWYAQYVEHLRPDVTVIDDSTITQHGLGDAVAVIESYLGQRPVFVIRTPYDLPRLAQRYVLTPVPGVTGGPVYEVDGMLAASESTADR